MAQTRLRFTVVSEELAGAQFELAADRAISVGRTKDNALVLNHRSVSRRHARIEPNGAGWRIVDLDSHNGTRVGEELVTERDLEPGDEVTFGEITVQWMPVDAGEATPSDALPATIGGATATALPVRPLSLGEVFPGAPPPEPVEEAGERGLGGAMAYSLTLIGIIVAGLLAIWKVSQPPPREPTIEVQLKAGEVLPVNVSQYRRDARGRRALFGLTRVRAVGRPQHEHIAYARKSKFRTIIVVKALAVGTTDVPLEGPPHGAITLRVLVRGVKPPPPEEEWMNEPLAERVARAKDLVQRATNAMTATGVVTVQTTAAIQNFRQAVVLFGSDPRHRAEATWAAGQASKLSEMRDKFFDIQSRDIATLETQGRWEDVEAKMEGLLRVFNDPRDVEHHIIRAEYERLVERIAYEQRKAQERR